MQQTSEHSPTSLYRFWTPRYWPMWCLLGGLRLGALLPFKMQLKVSSVLGRTLSVLVPVRRRVVSANLSLCFPDLSKSERKQLARSHFGSLGMMLFELALAWWASDERLAKLTRVEGLENLLTPIREGKPVIAVSGHFAGQEVAGRVVGRHFSNAAAVYRRSNNALFDEWLRRGRLRTLSRLVPKEDARQMVRLLRAGTPLWYASDQSYRRKHSALVPFFGEPAMTSTALSDIARLGRAVVVPYFPRRLADGSGYVVEIAPALEDFPSGDVQADAVRIHELLENQIRKAPEQYYWVHRRFKGRPEGYPDPYA